MDALKLGVETLPGDEDWAVQEGDEDTTRFERMVDVTEYRIAATVLATDGVDGAVTTYEEERDRADAYTGVEVQDVDLASAAFGYQLTSNEGTVVFRDTNVVGELLYGLAEHEIGRGVEIELQTVVDYAALWHDSWR